MTSLQPIAQRLAFFAERARVATRLTIEGRVTRVVGLTIEAMLPNAALGELCVVGADVLAEVIGIVGERVIMMPLDDLRGISAGVSVKRTGQSTEVSVGDGLLGRVLNGRGQPIDGKGPVYARASRPLRGAPLAPLERAPVRHALYTGIRAIDGLLTCGRGQRVGIVAGPGVGKTVLLSMLAERAECDVLVLALVGERGREVGEFVRHFSTSSSSRRTVVLAATSDRPALERLRAAEYATAVAEHFRDQQKNVLLVMDSLTRVAMAQREIGLAVGEPPATKGYPPSVFAMLPGLLERAGASVSGGSVTGVYTVLMEGDDLADPVADAAIAILDGQIVLSRTLAGKGHFPSIDPLKSVSRVMPDVVGSEHLQAAQRVRSMLGALDSAEALLSVGAYEPGHNSELDLAVAKREQLDGYLRQEREEASSAAESVHWLRRLARPVEAVDE